MRLGVGAACSGVLYVAGLPVPVPVPVPVP